MPAPCTAALGHQAALPLRRLAADASQLQVGPDPGQQLAAVERLDQVVVGPGRQPFDARVFPRPGREQHDGHGPGPGIGTQLTQQAKPVQVRHHHVGKHQVRRSVPAGRQRGLPVGDPFDVVSSGQQAAQVLSHVRVIVRHEHPRPRARRLPDRRSVGRRPGGSCPALAFQRVPHRRAPGR